MTKISMMLAQAQATPEATRAAGPSGLATLVPMLPFILLFGAMYFMVIAPQRKKQKEHERMLSELKSGDEVVTTGGIYGVITSVKDDRFVIRVGDNNAKVEVGKGFIHSVVTRKSEAP